MSPKAEPERGAAVLERAVSLLDALAEHGEMRPADLAELVGEPRSTVYRLLSTMRDLGLVETGLEKGTQRLGLKLIRLGAAAGRGLDLRATALPVMETLHDELGETVFLCVRRGSEGVCVERLEGHRVQVLAMRLGDALPLHLGAAPLTLLAFEPREAWQAYVDSGPDFEAVTSRSITGPEELLEHLAETAERGWSISDEDVTDGIAAVGAPIFDGAGNVIAALSVAGIRKGILGPDATAGKLTKEAADQISAALGHQDKEKQNPDA